MNDITKYSFFWNITIFICAFNSLFAQNAHFTNGEEIQIEEIQIWEQSQDIRPSSNAVFSSFDGKQQSFTTQTHYWLRLKVSTHHQFSSTYFLDVGNWAIIDVFESFPKSQQPDLQLGRFRPIPPDFIGKHDSQIPIHLSSKEHKVIYIHLQEKMNFYEHSQLNLSWESEEKVRQNQENRLFYQGIFLGIILVMGLYNLLIYTAVKDSSFLLYVISLLGIGSYFMFYYDFSLQFIWKTSPIWNAYSFAFIVPLTRISWILFTQKYLNLSQTLPNWNKWLYLLLVIYFLPLILGFVSWQTTWDLSYITVQIIAILGIIVLSMMVLVGILLWQQGYQPARYFVIANLIFSIGSILFIFRETGYLPDTPLTRYASQVGVALQAVLFSLGLGNRLNEMRKALVQKALETERLEKEKERERKQLIENQKIDLENQVVQRTTDLQEKTKELEQAFIKLQESEKDLRVSNELKDKLFSVISHDLRSPLTSLNSLLNILTHHREMLTPEEEAELSYTTQQNLKNVSYLLDNLLSWARRQMNTLSYQPEELYLTKIIDEILALLEPTCQYKSIHIRVEIAENYTVIADKDMLALILRNLLWNAVKFTQQNGEVSINAEKLSDEKLKIEVRDTGVGMSAEKIQKIQSPHSLKISTLGTNQEQGVGLGLLLCQDFLSQHQEKLNIESQVGKGTKISFELPLASSI